MDCQSEIDVNYDNLLKQDRVTSDGEILHPYSVYWNNSILIIKFPYSTEEAMKKRSDSFSI